MQDIGWMAGQPVGRKVGIINGSCRPSWLRYMFDARPT